VIWLIIISGLVRQSLFHKRKLLMPGGGRFDSCHKMFIHQTCCSWNPKWPKETMTQSKREQCKM
jgi:hypothetical protein